MIETEAPPRRATEDEIPVIDLGPLSAGGDLQALAADIRRTCCRTGFFYAAGHGIPQDVIDGVFAASRGFFAQPLEARMAVVKNRFHRGYLPVGTTRYPGLQADHKDSFDLAHDLPLDDASVVAGLPFHGPNQWPALPGFRTAVETYFHAVQALGDRLLRVLALSLELDEGYFQRWNKKPLTTMRLMHYPPPAEAAPADDVGIGALKHTDYGFFTILAQDPSGGLELLMPDGLAAGGWVAAPYVPGTFVINMGDLMQRWSNDLYRSNVHRVVNRLGRDRYSIPAFFNLDYDAPAACLPTCTGPDRPPRYPEISAGEHLLHKIRTNQGFKPAA
jgi:isopenicillin N synthase-like dioxygenase